MRGTKSVIYVLASAALFMHFAVQITPLWAPLLGTQTIQICTAQGFDSVTIDEYGREVPTPKTKNTHCNFCLAASADIMPPIAPAYRMLIPQSEKHQRWVLHTFSTTRFYKYAAHLTRGPPTLS